MSRAGDTMSAGIGRLIEDLAALVENEDLADIVFLIGPQEERVFAHSLILKARQAPITNKTRGYGEIPTL